MIHGPSNDKFVYLYVLVYVIRKVFNVMHAAFNFRDVNIVYA